MNVDGRWQLNLELGRVVEMSDTVSERGSSRDVPACGFERRLRNARCHPIISMPSSASGKPKPTIVPGHVVEIADPLLGECLGQLRVWASLPWHRADAHVLEVAVDSHRDRTYRALQSMADGFPEGGDVQGPAQGDRRPR